MNRDVYSVWSILVFPVFYWNQWMTAVRTFKRIRSGKTFFFWRKGSGTYFTEELPFGIIVFIKVWFRGITAWAGTAVVNITFVPALNRFDLFAIPPFQIRDVFFVIPFLVINDLWKLVNPKFLIFGWMESSKAHCLRGIYLQIKFKSQQICLCWYWISRSK